MEQKPRATDRMSHTVLTQVRGAPDSYYADPAGTQVAGVTPESLVEKGFFEVADETMDDPRYPNVARKLTFARIDTSAG